MRGKWRLGEELERRYHSQDTYTILCAMAKNTLDDTHACYTLAGSSASRESTNALSLLQLNNWGSNQAWWRMGRAQATADIDAPRSFGNHEPDSMHRSRLPFPKCLQSLCFPPLPQTTSSALDYQLHATSTLASVSEGFVRGTAHPTSAPCLLRGFNVLLLMMNKNSNIVETSRATFRTAWYLIDLILELLYRNRKKSSHASTQFFLYLSPGCDTSRIDRYANTHYAIEYPGV
jgi:hypothetical protein